MPLSVKNRAIHRPGPLRQSNKPHKRNRNKRKQHVCEKGRGDVKVLAKSVRSCRKKDLGRQERKHRAVQLRQKKREEIISQKRKLGGFNSPSVLVAIIALSSSQDAMPFLERLKECDEGLNVTYSSKGYCHIRVYRAAILNQWPMGRMQPATHTPIFSCRRFKQRFTFIVPEPLDIHAVMDAAKVADTLLFVHFVGEIDEYIDMLLSVLLGHALPTTIHVVQGLDELIPNRKADVKKYVIKSMESRFPNEKLLDANSKQDLLLVLRQIGSHKQRPVGFRDCRSHLLSESIEFCSNEETETGSGTLKVSGYVRGQPLDVNGLVHIPGWGDFQMSQIDYISDPHPLNVTKSKTFHLMNEQNEEMVLEEAIIVDKADPSMQESLQSHAVPDPMDGEQTWPTEEELTEADSQHSERTVRKVVEGTNVYQAAWIVDSSNSEDSSCSDEEEIACQSAISDCELSQEDCMEYEDAQEAEDIVEDKYDESIDEVEEKKMLVRFREEHMEQLFPDERDTPADAPARIRYQRYRGLKSFANSIWDPMESLPPEYAKLYRFQNFRQTKRKILNADKEGALPGMYVTLHIINVTRALFDSVELSPLIVYGLLPHEQKMSCVNVVIKKHPLCLEPVKSKDKLIFHIGFRRFVCQPLFSVHDIGNKFKYERFLPRDSAVVASFYAPITFPPASVVIFKENCNGSQTLVATGSLLDINPDRLIIKRIVLSGHPFKIFKKTAVVRYMFFNREDILWFKCIELYTRHGRKGHIREPLGTHGHMKCIFDQQLKSADVVFMSLYKRVFPKHNYDPVVPTPVK